MSTLTALTERIRTQRYVTAMAALDTVELLAERVLNLLAHGRRITIARRYTYIDRPPEVHAGLTVDGQPRVWAKHDGVGVNLKPGLRGFGFSACAGRAGTEKEVWDRYHANEDDRRDMTLVEIDGGLPGDDYPSQDDRIVIRCWNTHGVCDETVVVFDCGPGRDDAELQLRDLAEWLVSLDVPDGQDRHAVTLDQIVQRAREALDKED